MKSETGKKKSVKKGKKGTKKKESAEMSSKAEEGIKIE
jgi:hypothetical protein